MSWSAGGVVRTLGAVCATGLVLLTLLAAATNAFPLGSYLLALAVLVSVLLGFLAPSRATRWAPVIALVAIVPLKWAGSAPSFDFEDWMCVSDVLPLSLLALAALFGTWFVVRSRRTAQGRRASWPIVVALLAVAATELPAWALAGTFDAYLIEPEGLSLLLTALAVWVPAARGLIHGGAWLRGTVGRRSHRLSLGLALAAALVGLGWGILAEESAEYDPRGDESPYALALRVHGELGDYYPHWNSAPIGREELWRSRRQRLVAEAHACHSEAADRNEPCIGVLRLLQDMLAALGNGHTWLRIDADLGHPAVELRPVADGVVVDWVEEGSEAELKGLEEGMEIVAVDGSSVVEAAKRTPAWLTAYSANRTRVYESQRGLLVGPPGTVVSLTVEDRHGSRRTVELTRRRVFEAGDGAGDNSDEQSRIEGFSVERGISYIYLDGFEGEGLVAEFDRLLDEAFDAHGLILDLRENSGGSPRLAERILGRFFPKEVVYAEDCDGFHQDEEEPYCEEKWIQPRLPAFRLPLAVLVNEQSASAAEIVAYALCRVGEARCFGRTTMGESDLARREQIPGGLYYRSVSHTRPIVGPPLLGEGVEPHVRVELTVADVREGRDPTLAAARRWIRKQM